MTRHPEIEAFFEFHSNLHGLGLSAPPSREPSQSQILVAPGKSSSTPEPPVTSQQSGATTSGAAAQV